MKVVGFAASNSRDSINKRLVTFAVSLLEGVETEILDLNDYELPLYSVDQEKLLGQPDAAKRFYEKLSQSDAIVISFAEHNGIYSAAYKNMFDWCSRINQKVYENKPMVLLSTSPGARGGLGVLEHAEKSMPYFGGIVKACYALPSFNDTFDQEKGGVKDPASLEKVKTAVLSLMA